MIINPLLRHFRYRLQSRLPRLYPGAMCCLSTSDEIAVTVDDGPSESSPMLLDAFEEAGIRATFFLSAAAALEFPREVRRMREHGHTIASHGFAHEDLSRKPRAAVAEDIERSVRTIEQVAGHRPTLFRPPYGRLHPMHRDLPSVSGCRLVLWSLMPADYDAAIPSTDLARRLDRVCAGDIIVLHDRPATADRSVLCIRHLATLLRRRGLRAVTL